MAKSYQNQKERSEFYIRSHSDVRRSRQATLMKRIESFLIKEETLHNVMKLKTMVKQDDALAVLMFGSPDPDAVASCMALQELLRQTAGLSK